MLGKYYRMNQAVGVNIHLLQNGDLQISACQVVVEGSKLSFGKKVTGLADIEELKRHIQPKSLIALNLSGRGILQKQVEKTEVIAQHNFGNVLPNGQMDDFYIQNFISGDQSFVSVIRKAEANKWLDQIKSAGFITLQLSLGPFPVNNIVEQLNIYGPQLIFNGNVIDFEENSTWNKYNYVEVATSAFPLKIASEIIDEKLLVPYAAAFQLILSPGIGPVKTTVPVLDDTFEQLIDKKKFQVKGALILCMFFILLLINFITFSWLNTSNAGLIEQVSKSVQSNVNIQSLNDQLKQKEALLRNLGWEDGINKSTLVDQLASVLPEEVTWAAISVDPIDATTSRMQKSVVFFNRKITITGNSEEIIPVNEWIARIKTKPWVKNARMNSYTFNNELNTGQFTVVINY